MTDASLAYRNRAAMLQKNTFPAAQTHKYPHRHTCSLALRVHSKDPAVHFLQLCAFRKKWNAFSWLATLPSCSHTFLRKMLLLTIWHMHRTHDIHKIYKDSGLISQLLGSETRRLPKEPADLCPTSPTSISKTLERHQFQYPRPQSELLNRGC